MATRRLPKQWDFDPSISIGGYGGIKASIRGRGLTRKGTALQGEERERVGNGNERMRNIDGMKIER